MEKGYGEDKKREIFHVGQIEKQNAKMKNGKKVQEQKERMERPKSVCY